MNERKSLTAIGSIILFLILYPIGYSKLGVQANTISMIPILYISLSYGKNKGILIGMGTSVSISIFRIVTRDPDFVILNAILIALFAGVGGGLFGLISDQRKALANSEKILTQKVEEQTAELKRLLNELNLAYETTLEGWAHALELRDKETEGHSRRVTDLSMKIAKKAGLTEEEIRFVRYGALLHDIGKMGIPDHILNKPGPLSPEERIIVEQHPIYAFDLLKDIPYLKDAIIIPYCHHERWNGTGYPQGLREEEIPIQARIFAVVDNWDALTSDRPYRKAWSRKATLAYIQEQNGVLFDPKIVNLFQETINYLPSTSQMVDDD